MPTTDVPAAPATMRAIAAPTWGTADVLEPVMIARPEPGPTEILVAVHAAGINPTDWKARASGGFGLWGDPPILGYDVSGVVEAVGLGASLFQPGDEVFGMPRFPEQAGGYAEYIAAPSRRFAPKPEGLDHVQAAALPLVGLTAWQALSEVAQVKPGQRVLIHAGAGGVGHVGVQIAKALGAHVIATASTPKHELLRSLGADELIDYRETDFAATLRDVDVVLETIGGEYGTRLARNPPPGRHPRVAHGTARSRGRGAWTGARRSHRFHPRRARPRGAARAHRARRVRPVARRDRRCAPARRRRSRAPARRVQPNDREARSQGA